MKNEFDYLERPDGVRLRYGKWESGTLPTRGTVLLFNGRTEFMEKYLEAIERLNRMGLDVFSLDWRGQGLSTRLLKNRRKGYVKSYGDYMADAAAFVETIFAPEASAPRILMGHSMGGHIALRFVGEHAKSFDKAVLLSPMVDINTFPFPENLLKLFTRAAAAAGYDKAYISGNDRLTVDKFEGNVLTSCRSRFEKCLAHLEKNESLIVGGVTIGWLRASFDSIDLLREPGFAESVKTPVLLFSAAEDRVVCNRAQRKIGKKLPDCRFVEIPGARHEILQEKDAVQKPFWDALEKFIDLHNPGKKAKNS